MWVHGRFLVDFGGLLPVGDPKAFLDQRGAEEWKNLKRNLTENAELRAFFDGMEAEFSTFCGKEGFGRGNSGAVASTRVARESEAAAVGTTALHQASDKIFHGTKRVLFGPGERMRQPFEYATARCSEAGVRRDSLESLFTHASTKAAWAMTIRSASK
jgi:hypothetical protein